MRKIYCHNCGSELEVDDLFCTNCGEKTQISNKNNTNDAEQIQKMVNSVLTDNEYNKKLHAKNAKLCKNKKYVTENLTRKQFISITGKSIAILLIAAVVLFVAYILMDW
ncbi:MAG: zinc ribbon domain-containing protein [Methanosarcinaceae archaeon]|nr:zinc ribbon domain-containing protein [Methanosarcinaceae archaeon]